MMKKEIVVDINPFQTRVVLLEDDKPVEIYIERRGHERLRKKRRPFSILF